MNTMKKDIGKAGIVAIMLMSSLTVMVGNAITPALYFYLLWKTY